MRLSKLNWIVLSALIPALFLAWNPGQAAGQQAKAKVKEKELTQRVTELESENQQLRAEVDQITERLDTLLGRDDEARIHRLPLADSPIRGNEEAAVTLVEFGDYQSDYTARAEHVVKRLLEEYPKSLRFVFKHYPVTAIHPQANEAALAALAGQKQEKGWEMHDLLIKNSRRLEPALILMLAKQLGLDLTQFEQERRSLWALERLSADEKLAVRVQVVGVPTFFLNGRRMANWRYDYLKGQLEKLLEREKKRKLRP